MPDKSKEVLNTDAHGFCGLSRIKSVFIRFHLCLSVVKKTFDFNFRGFQTVSKKEIWRN